MIEERGVDMSGLKPCPFCGGDYETFLDAGAWPTLRCLKCGALISERDLHLSGGFVGAVKRLKAKWNRRIAVRYTGELND